MLLVKLTVILESLANFKFGDACLEDPCRVPLARGWLS
jgi:hypothetical protein